MTKFTEAINDCQQAAADMPNTFVFAILDWIAASNKDLALPELIQLQTTTLKGIYSEYHKAEVRALHAIGEMEQEGY